MNYYANPDERRRLTAGLREVADFLDQNPHVPAPRHTDLLVFPAQKTDAELFAEIDVIAEQIGVTPMGHQSPAAPYPAHRHFGPVQSRAVAIPHAARPRRSEEAGQ